MDVLGWPSRPGGKRLGLLGSTSLLAGAAAMLAVMALPPRAAFGQAAPPAAAAPQAVATTGQQDSLTQAQLAERLDVSRQTVIALEGGKYDPSLPLAFAIARTFECSIEDVFTPDA